MRGVDFNLAGRPFVNFRPVIRAAVLFWLVGGILAGFNGWLYWRHFTGRSEQSAQLANIDLRIEAERKAVERLRGELSAIDLEWQNRQVAFLNSRIEQRAFSWSALFDDLAEVMPSDLQLRRVTPRIHRAETLQQRRSGREGRREGVVHIAIGGSARRDEALLEFIDSLFSHPGFRDPDLMREARQEDGLIDFALSVDYLPGASSGNAAGNTEVTSEATIEQGAEDGGSAEEVPTASGRAG